MWGEERVYASVGCHGKKHLLMFAGNKMDTCWQSLAIQPFSPSVIS